MASFVVVPVQNMSAQTVCIALKTGTNSMNVLVQALHPGHSCQVQVQRGHMVVALSSTQRSKIISKVIAGQGSLVINGPGNGSQTVIMTQTVVSPMMMAPPMMAPPMMAPPMMAAPPRMAHAPAPYQPNPTQQMVTASRVSLEAKTPPQTQKEPVERIQMVKKNSGNTIPVKCQDLHDSSQNLLKQVNLILEPDSPFISRERLRTKTQDVENQVVKILREILDLVKAINVGFNLQENLLKDRSVHQTLLLAVDSLDGSLGALEKMNASYNENRVRFMACFGKKKVTIPYKYLKSERVESTVKEIRKLTADATAFDIKNMKINLNNYSGEVKMSGQSKINFDNRNFIQMSREEDLKGDATMSDKLYEVNRASLEPIVTDGGDEVVFLEDPQFDDNEMEPPAY